VEIVKITSDDRVLCLSCGVDDDGVIVSLEDRADLKGEKCDQCERGGE
jgi:formate dehydrogenase maturation protein FdhE